MLLLRSRGRMSAAAPAAEWEVSTRTVLRASTRAVSSAGVPVYAERGRAGRFALLPDFTTDITGLTPDEALMSLTAGSGAGAESLGMAPALADQWRRAAGVYSTWSPASRCPTGRCSDDRRGGC
jgi:predicted DNA-binding transcriptional regulator YafY